VASSSRSLRITYIGGPTAILDWGGLRLLTDPTFDAAGASLPGKGYTLTKTKGPAVEASGLGSVDAVLLSHDHHGDNLDHAGRALLVSAREILTTVDGAGRLKGHAVGLRPWQRTSVSAPDGGVLRVTATPARHGPPNGDRGPVIGFLLAFEDDPARVVYVSGDTVWYEGVEEVARRQAIEVAVLFMGAAKVAVAGDSPLTFTSAGAVEAARALGGATIVPLHYEGWQHFSESRADIERAFAEAGMTDRLRWLPAGVATEVG
jgi:L-ascorbate metabolism protein UlaG (beta-lactamase superfamily)